MRQSLFFNDDGYYEEGEYNNTFEQRWGVFNSGGSLATSSVSPDGIFDLREEAEHYAEKILPELIGTHDKFTVKKVNYRPATIETTFMTEHGLNTGDQE